MLEIQKNNQTIQLRNLQEQVQKNKEDIANHYNIDRVLADFGIKVVGSVNNASQLPDPTEYSGNFGDAFAVGIEAPYSFYIYTRPDVNSGHPDNYWLDIGPLGIVGPEGPRGYQGPQGPKGEATKMYASTIEPTNTKDGDLWLNSSNGNISSYSIQLGWTIVGNLRGPQGVQGDQGIQGLRGPTGPQGPKGDTGDVGGFININGILSNTDQLPTPASLNDLTRAYLIGSSAPYDLYIQVGSTSDNAVWTNMGVLNVATYITVNGVYQNTWNADTKLDKDTSTTSYNQAYIKAANGGQGSINVTKQLVADCIPQRKSNSNIAVPTTPSEDSDAASKKYVDDSLNVKLDKITSTYGDTKFRLYAIDNQGIQQIIITTDNNNQVATKLYVDEAVANAGGSGGGGRKPYTLIYYLYQPKSVFSGEIIADYIIIKFESNSSDYSMYNISKTLYNEGYIDETTYLATNIECKNYYIPTLDITGAPYVLKGVYGESDNYGIRLMFVSVDGRSERNDYIRTNQLLNFSQYTNNPQ